MSTPESELRDAMAAHKAERFGEAEAGYRRVLEARPNDPKALYYLGLLHFHRGDTEAALDCVSRCLDRAPTHPHAWNTLGSMLIAAGRPADAKAAYQRVTEVAPAMAEGWYNLGICLRNEGDMDGALTQLREAITRQPDYFLAHEALGMLLYQLGRMEDAVAIYAQWAASDPSNAKARHMAAASSKENVPSRASDEYIQALFDSSAEKFDANLEQLNYRAPELVAAAFIRCAKAGGGPARASDRAASRPALAVLDAGCGTGLSGSLIRAYCSTLVGVDLSPKMIERAESRGVYDELVPAELSDFMRSRPSTFDTVICADTLAYFGSLEEPLRAAHEALLPSGWLIFTVEALPASMEGTPDHRLEFHGRYAHSEAYVRRILDETGFELETLSHETLRQERLQDVRGFLVTARRR